MAKASVLVLPGLGGSGPEHWQSDFERRNPGFRRVDQADWDQPQRDAWIATLEAAVTAAQAPVVLASSGDPYCAIARACTFAAQWGADFIDVGAHSHINIASGHGPWPKGERLLADLIRQVEG